MSAHLTPHDDITYLERRIEGLIETLRKPHVEWNERVHIERQIGLAVAALGHYRNAHEIDQRLKLKSCA